MNKINFDDNILLCPKCNGDYLHHVSVELFERNEDDKKGEHVQIISKNVIIKHDELVDNPSPRRNGIYIYFWCEQCGTELKLSIYQHKGQTIIEWV